MALSNPNAPEVLREEIFAQARDESEQILRRARQEAEALVARATADAEKARQARLDQARVEGRRRRELILATVPVEAGRLRSARLEALLESVHNEVRRRLAARDGFDYHEVLISLAAEAIQQMRGNAFVVKLSAADRAIADDRLGGEIARRVARSPLEIVISNGPATECGAIIEDGEGRQTWDDRLLARLERMWPELRRQIAIEASLVAGSKPAGGAT